MWGHVVGAMPSPLSRVGDVRYACTSRMRSAGDIVGGASYVTPYTKSRLRSCSASRLRVGSGHHTRTSNPSPAFLPAALRPPLERTDNSRLYSAAASVASALDFGIRNSMTRSAMM